MSQKNDFKAFSLDEDAVSNVAVNEDQRILNETSNNLASDNGVSILNPNFYDNESQIHDYDNPSNVNEEMNSHLLLSFSNRSSNSSLCHPRNSSILRNALNITNIQNNTNANETSEEEINISTCPENTSNFRRPTETDSNQINYGNLNTRIYNPGLVVTSSSEINGNYDVANSRQLLNQNMYYFRNNNASSESFPVSSQESTGRLNLSYDDQVLRAGGENAPQPLQSSGQRGNQLLFRSSSSDLSMITAFENFNLVSDNSSIATDEILDEISSFIMSESSFGNSSTSDSSESSSSSNEVDASFSGMLPTIENMTNRLTTALESLQSTINCDDSSTTLSDQMINNFNRLRRRSLQTAENAAETVRNMNSFLSTYSANSNNRGYAQISSISERLQNVSNSLTSALQAIQTEMNRSTAPDRVSTQRNSERIGSSKSRRKAGCRSENTIKSKDFKEKVSSVQKKSTVVKCPVCFKTYDDLMCSDLHLVHGKCGHVICSSCADILKNERLIRCPVCRKKLKSKGNNPFKRVYLATE